MNSIEVFYVWPLYVHQSPIKICTTIALLLSITYRYASNKQRDDST